MKDIIFDALQCIDSTQDDVTIETCCESIDAYSRYYQLLCNNEFDDNYRLIMIQEEASIKDEKQPSKKKKNIFEKIIDFFKMIIEKIFGKKIKASTDTSASEKNASTRKEIVSNLKNSMNHESQEKKEKNKAGPIAILSALGVGAAGISGFIGRKLDKVSDVFIEVGLKDIIHIFLYEPEEFDKFMKRCLDSLNKTASKNAADYGVDSPELKAIRQYNKDYKNYKDAYDNFVPKHKNEISVKIQYDEDDRKYMLMMNDKAADINMNKNILALPSERQDLHTATTNFKYIENYVQQYVRFNHIELLGELMKGFCTFLEKLQDAYQSKKMMDENSLTMLFDANIIDPYKKLKQFIEHEKGLHVVARDIYATNCAALFNKIDNKPSLYEKVGNQVKAVLLISEKINSENDKDKDADIDANIEKINKFIVDHISTINEISLLINDMQKIIIEDLELADKYDKKSAIIMAQIKNAGVENTSAVTRVLELFKYCKETGQALVHNIVTTSKENAEKEKEILNMKMLFKLIIILIIIIIIIIMIIK